MPAHSSALAAALADDVLERFLRYVRVASPSAPGTGRTPSTPGQQELAALVAGELEALGAASVSVGPDGVVVGHLGASGASGSSVVALLAHLDTTPDAPGEGVEPIVHRAYDGTTITLPRGGTTLDPDRMPELRSCLGDDIVTSSGDTLLGADDKAGMAAIMAAAGHLAAHPELPRTELRMCFTPDEEIGGTGARGLDLQRLGAVAAYTLDGSGRGELQVESFSARDVVLEVEGVEVHPGQAYGRMVNAVSLLARMLATLPGDRLTPETSRDRQGYIHVHGIDGDVRRARAQLILRDFDEDALEGHMALLQAATERLRAAEPRASVKVSVEAPYRNMGLFLERRPEVVERAERAIRAEGLRPVRVPIRGGTDGSVLSERGLPTPNLFTGGHEWHSVREWASVQEMASAAAVVVRLAGEWAENP